MNLLDYEWAQPLSQLEQKAIERYFSEESRCKVSEAYLKEPNSCNLRRNVIKYIDNLNVRPQYDGLIFCRAMSYFDRFASSFTEAQQILALEKDLVAFCCVSLAWKVKSFSSFLNFLYRSDLSIDPEDFRRMELEVLIRLDWRMFAAIPFDFVKYFLSQVPVDACNKAIVNRIIIEAQEEIQFAIFKPSVIAASAILVAVASYMHNMCKDILLNCGNKKLDGQELDDCLPKIIVMCQDKNLLPVEKGSINFKLQQIAKGNEDLRIDSSLSQQKGVPDENETDTDVQQGKRKRHRDI